jgi:hypothetical protein
MNEKSPDLSYRTDRDSHFLAAQHVPLLEERVGHVVAARFHRQSLDLPYIAVGRTDGQFAAYVNIAEWNRVDGDLLRGFRSARAAGTGHPQSVSGRHRKKVHAERRALVSGGVEVRHHLGLLGGLERLELGQGTAKPDLTRRSVHKVNRNKPPWAIPVLLADYDMSDFPGDRVHDYATHLTAGSIAATGVGPDPERHLPRHSHHPRSLDPNKSSQQQPSELLSYGLTFEVEGLSTRTMNSRNSAMNFCRNRAVLTSVTSPSSVTRSGVR